MTSELVVERHDATLLLRLNRPDARNALNGAVVNALGAALAGAEQDPGTRAVVLTGTGDRAFSAGMDLREFSAGGLAAVDPEAMATFLRLMAGEITVPVVGAAQATALAGGFELLLGCDLVVASTEAVFGLPEVKRGLFPAGGGTAIVRRMPYAVAMELLLTGDSIPAERAAELGLVNVVVPPAEVVPTGLELAGRIAGNAPLSLAACKELARLAVADDAAYVARRDHWRAVVFASEDAKEGATAYVEKRTPQWRGV